MAGYGCSWLVVSGHGRLWRMIGLLLISWLIGVAIGEVSQAQTDGLTIWDYLDDTTESHRELLLE